MIFIFLLISVFNFFSISFNSLTGHHKKFTLTDFHQEVFFFRERSGYKRIMKFQTLVDASAQWFLVHSVPILSINTYNYVKLKHEPRHCELI